MHKHRIIKSVVMQVLFQSNIEIATVPLTLPIVIIQLMMGQ